MEFRAVYEAAGIGVEGIRNELELGPPQEILDADLRPIMAYPLDVVTFRVESRLIGWRYWLDGALQVVRVDLPCPTDAEACIPSVSYKHRGFPAPFGIGYPEWVQDGANTVRTMAGNETVHAIRSGTAESLKIDFLSSPVTEAWLTTEIGYLYEGQDPVPAELALRYDGPEARAVRVAIERREPLPPIGRMPVFTPPSREPGTGLYPGFEDDVLGWNASAADAVAEMARQSPEFQDKLQQGCITEVSYVPQADLQPLPGINWGPRFKYQIRLHSLGAASEWVMTGTNTPLGLQWDAIRQDPTSSPEQASCELAGTRAGRSIQEFLEQISQRQDVSRLVTLEWSSEAEQVTQPTKDPTTRLRGTYRLGIRVNEGGGLSPAVVQLDSAAVILGAAGGLMGLGAE